jgi:dimethylargininase
MFQSTRLNYEYALVCSDIPNTLINGLSLSSDHEPVNLQLAREQHQTYINYLKDEANIKLIYIDPNDFYPDCVFVEDCVISLDNKILITNPGAESRRGEIEIVSKLFYSKELNNKLNLDIYEIQNKQEAFIDGGDCCWTGREFIIGKSNRTNQLGIDEFKRCFSSLNVHVTVCDVIEGLHLKSVMSMFAENTILIGKSKAAQFIRGQIEQNAVFKYKFVEIEQDENGSANVLWFNNRLVYPKSFEYLYMNLKEFTQQDQVFGLDNSEFKKIDGCLTCRSVFFNKSS